MPNIELKISYKCSSHCTHCLFRDKWNLSPMTENMVSDNLKHFSSGEDLEEIVISGGEPSEHDDFIKIIHMASGLSNSLYLHTNAGFPLYDNLNFVKNYITRSMVSYHKVGGNSAITDECIRQMITAGINLRTNTLILAGNENKISEIIHHANQLGVRNMLFTFPFPLGGTQNSNNRIILSNSQRLHDIIDGIVDLTLRHNISISFQGIPRCFLGVHAELQDRWVDRILVDINHQLQHSIMLFDGLLGRQYLPSCTDCAEKSICSGTWPLSWHRNIFFHKKLVNEDAKNKSI